MNILIIYELYNREYENAQLLARELINRGHIVNIVDKATCFKFKGDIDVLIIPNCYTSDNYEFYKFMTNAKNAKIINLQYEQVLSENWEKIGYHNPKGKARDAISLCWGNNSYQRLLSSGVPKENLRLTGALHLDFLSNRFSKFYLQKKEIATSMNLNSNNKWILYISSFTLAGDNGIIADTLLNSFKSEKQTIQDFVEVSIISRKITLEWIEKLLLENKDIHFLYRLHPNEIEDGTLKYLEQAYSGRFFCVDMYSVKQWIYVSDIVFTWFSTSIIESYYAHKNCYVLRPAKIPGDMDSVVFKGVKEINDYTSFKEIIKQDSMIFSNANFSINEKLIANYYSNDGKNLTYIKIADVIEENYTKDKITKKYFAQRLKFILSHSEPWKSIIEKIYCNLYRNFKIKLSNISPWKKRYLSQLENRIKNLSAISREQNRKNNLLITIVNNIKNES
jgi:surface carbohydrate biosynthesis protein